MAHSEIFTALHTVWSEVVRNHGCLSWERDPVSGTLRRATLSNKWVVEVDASRHGIVLEVWPPCVAPNRVVSDSWVWTSEEVADEEHEMLLTIAKASRTSTARAAG